MNTEDGPHIFGDKDKEVRITGNKTSKRLVKMEDICAFFPSIVTISLNSHHMF